MELSQLHPPGQDSLGSVAAFKQHATFGLWQGAMVLGPDGGKLDDAMGQFERLTRIADLPGKRELTGYLKQAMKLIDDGVKRSLGPPAQAARAGS